MDNRVSFIPIGGVGDVTKNMSAYIYGDEILLVDCGIGFANESFIKALKMQKAVFLKI